MGSWPCSEPSQRALWWKEPNSSWGEVSAQSLLLWVWERGGLGLNTLASFLFSSRWGKREPGCLPRMSIFMSNEDLEGTRILTQQVGVGTPRSACVASSQVLFFSTLSIRSRWTLGKDKSQLLNRGCKLEWRNLLTVFGLPFAWFLIF